MSATTVTSAYKVVALPGAAPAPVFQHPRRGRFPAKVHRLCMGRPSDRLRTTRQVVEVAALDKEIALIDTLICAAMQRMDYLTSQRQVLTTNGGAA